MNLMKRKAKVEFKYNSLCVVFDPFLFCYSEAGHLPEDLVSLVMLKAINFQIRFPQLLDCLKYNV